MAFVIGDIQSVRRKVEFALPADHGKQPKKADFMATFKVVDAETSKARLEEMQTTSAQYYKELQKLRDDPDHEIEVDPADLDEKYIREDLENLEGIFDKNKQELPFSEDVLAQVLNNIPARKALIRVWAEINLDGGKGIKAKN